MRIPSDFTRRVISLLLILLTAGCGYRYYSQADSVERNIKNIYVDGFTNDTPEAIIENDFRNAFISQFIKGQRFNVVDNIESADAILKGDIKNLVFANIAYRGENDLAVAHRITVTLSLTLMRKEGADAIIWSDQNFSQWADETLDEKIINAAQSSSRVALSKLANDTAERAYRIMTSDF